MTVFSGIDWTTFITSVFALYDLWYAGNILKDIIFSRGSAKPGGSVHYNIEGFLDKEEPVEVKEADFVASESHGPAPSRDTSQSIAFKGQPEGQGIPLAEFLKNAKKQAEPSARKIEFN